MSEKPLTPEPDRIAGVNFPYRGNVDHGVASPSVETPDESKYYEGVPVEFGETPEEAEPIPVRIVSKPGKESRDFATQQMVINTGQIVQIGGRNTKRTRLTVKFIGSVAGGAAERLFVGRAEVSQFSGYPLSLGQDLTINGTEPVYVAANTDGTIIATIQEYTEEYK